jgi:hypothetical protein
MHINARSVGALLLGLVSFLLPSFALGAENPDVIQVDAYKKKNGTTVQSYKRTAPNDTRDDNFGAKGNTNPNTGKSGTKPRDGESTSLKRPAAAQDATVTPKSPSAQLSRQSSPSTRSLRQAQAVNEQPNRRTHAELVATVNRCNQLLDSYVHASFGHSPFNAERYEQIRHERDTAQGELNAGR